MSGEALYTYNRLGKGQKVVRRAVHEIWHTIKMKQARNVPKEELGMKAKVI